MFSKPILTDEERVLKRLKNMAKSTLRFKEPVIQDYGELLRVDYNIALEVFHEDMKHLMSCKTVKSRVLAIFEMCSDNSTYQNNKFQCKGGARRSAHDIWRIYRNYFGEIDIFPIMRAMYDLTYNENKLGCHFCGYVRKQVFWLGGGIINDDYLRADIGVAFKNWEKIGLEA